MRFFHISDLHIGRQLNGYSLRENQEEVFSQIIAYAQKEKPDAILICGDIYDKSVPSGEAYKMFDCFLNGLSQIQPEIPALIIAGNHDSPERLNFASSFLERHRIYISVMPPVNENEYLKKVILSDAYGTVNFYLLPFFKPGYVQGLFPEGTVTGYESAFRALLERETVDFTERNVILAHQFFAGSSDGNIFSDSETAVLTAGGTDQIGVDSLELFDYAALGHLHAPQKVGKEHIRYSGTPYKYSVSEAHHQKGITVVTLKEKGTPVQIETLPLRGITDVRKIKGTLKEVLLEAEKMNRTAGAVRDFVSITLTDEEEAFDFREQLEAVYERILEIKIDNSRTRREISEQSEETPQLSPFDAFCEFFETVRHMPLSGEQEKIMREIIGEAGEDDR